MRNNLVSIILCTRDRKRLHKNTMPSINNQTYHPTELIIMVGEDNNNVMRNAGFEQAKGDYVFFMDEDIILHPDCIEKLMKCLGEANADFCYCDYDRTGTINGVQKGRPFDYEVLKKINYISTMSLIKRSVFPKFDPKIRRLQDYDLFLTIVENGGTGVYLEEVLFLAIYKDGSISTRGPDDWRKSDRIVKEKHNLI